MSDVAPNYRRLWQNGELRQRAERLQARLHACDLCPHQCRIDRAVRPGACRIGWQARLAAIVPHRGEEPPISGERGSGCLFLAGCNLHCEYCQNAQISQDAEHRLAPEVNARALADAMLQLQTRGCHNINWVSPAHIVPQLLAALDLAAADGLSLPIVYNTNAYENVDVLRTLDGIVDIYLPDLKYSSDLAAKRLSGAPGYPAISRIAVREMARQVGPLRLGSDGLAQRGLLVRHLVLPGGLAGTRYILQFIAESLPAGTAVSLMAQYAPAHRAYRWPALSRRLRHDEYEQALTALAEFGLDSGWVQDLAESPEYYRPDFGTDRPFADALVTRVDPPGKDG